MLTSSRRVLAPSPASLVSPSSTNFSSLSLHSPSPIIHSKAPIDAPLPESWETEVSKASFDLIRSKFHSIQDSVRRKDSASLSLFDRLLSAIQRIYNSESMPDEIEIECAQLFTRMKYLKNALSALPVLKTQAELKAERDRIQREIEYKTKKEKEADDKDKNKKQQKSDSGFDALEALLGVPLPVHRTPTPLSNRAKRGREDELMPSPAAINTPAVHYATPQPRTPVRISPSAIAAAAAFLTPKSTPANLKRPANATSNTAGLPRSNSIGTATFSTPKFTPSSVALTPSPSVWSSGIRRSALPPAPPSASSQSTTPKFTPQQEFRQPLNPAAPRRVSAKRRKIEAAIENPAPLKISAVSNGKSRRVLSEIKTLPTGKEDRNNETDDMGTIEEVDPFAMV